CPGRAARPAGDRPPARRAERAGAAAHRRRRGVLDGCIPARAHTRARPVADVAVLEPQLTRARASPIRSTAPPPLGASGAEAQRPGPSSRARAPGLRADPDPDWTGHARSAETAVAVR